VQELTPSSPVPTPDPKDVSPALEHDSFPSGPAQEPIGVFDSGIGGLSVLREITRQLPHQDVLYFADSAHVPYGERALEEIQNFSEVITSYLVQLGASVVVVACNTASAAALRHLRARFDVPIIGMEPAIKPAVEQSQSRHVGVIATRVTFQGELFARLVERFARNTTVHTQACPGLVERVEAGQTDDAETEGLLRQYLTPMMEAGIDSLVLGCTHYPFLRPAIERVLASEGSDVVLIDPSPAVARQTGRVLAGIGKVRHKGMGKVFLFTSGDVTAFEAQAYRLADISGSVQGVRWVGDEITLRDRGLEASP
jgi:glutamate racemase